MPCYTTTTISHNVGKWNEQRAKQAIEEVKKDLPRYTVLSIEYENGSIAVKTYLQRNSKATTEQVVSAVKKKYAELTLKEGAKKFGWSIKSQTTTKNDLTQISFTRR